MNSSYNYTNLDSVLSDLDNRREEYDYYTTEAVQHVDFSRETYKEPGIEAILFTGNRLRNYFGRT